MAEVAILVLGLLLNGLGIVGCVLPVLPGPFISWLSLFLFFSFLFFYMFLHLSLLFCCLSLYHSFFPSVSLSKDQKVTSLNLCFEYMCCSRWFSLHSLLFRYSLQHTHCFPTLPGSIFSLQRRPTKTPSPLPRFLPRCNKTPIILGESI